MSASEVVSEVIEEAGLRFVDADEPGLRRRTRRKGFVYLDPVGAVVRDEAVLARVRSLAIPPAWTDVWVCADEEGHIQATGRDARGRKQYRYHPRFRSAREEAKYGSLLPFGGALPAIRRRVDADLRNTDLGRDRVLALVVRLLEATAIRVGNDEYARANKSYGLTTLLDRHATFDRRGLQFVFRGKSGKDHAIAVDDRRMANLVRACQELPGQRLFQYIGEDGARHPVNSTDVNAYLRDISPFPVTAKHFRTWAGTQRVATRLAAEARPVADREATRVLLAAVDAVAGELGNTRAVCRSSYVHPAVTESFLDGSLQALWAEGPARPTRWLTTPERRLLHLLEQRTVEGARPATTSPRRGRRTGLSPAA